MKLAQIENTAEYNGKRMMLYPDEEFVPYKDIYETYYKGISVGEVKKVIRKYVVKENLCVGVISSHPPTESSVSNLFSKL